MRPFEHRQVSVDISVRTIIVLLIAMLLVISAAVSLAPRLRIPAPLILVMAGIGVSLVPGVPDVVIDPHIILLLFLPPLLYASATAIPAVNIRRDFGVINGLSVVLVVLSSLALGMMFTRLLPDLGLAWGVALGAVLSPTDAVATAIIKARGVPGRVAVILDGEGLLNDASALVMLTTAIVAAAVGFSFWPSVGSFLYAAAVAVVIGIVVARLNLAIRRRIRDEAVNTILSFSTPFAAAVSVEFLEGSGLVAAVVAGLVVGGRGPRVLPPGHRFSDARNWAAIEIILEGLIFLTMGLQLATIVRQVGVEPHGLGRGLAIAALALLVLLAVRGAYVVPLLWGLHRQSQRLKSAEPKVTAMRQELEAGRAKHAAAIRDGLGWAYEGARMFRHLARRLSDIDYLLRHPLGKIEGTIIFWAGMRGAVTVAAVQLLPSSAPHRPLLVFIAFSVAAMSLLIQGGTIGFLAARLFPPGENAEAIETREAEQRTIKGLLDHVGASIERRDGGEEKHHRRAIIVAKRNALLDAADHGVFDTGALKAALLDLDIDELLLDLRDQDSP